MIHLVGTRNQDSKFRNELTNKTEVICPAGRISYYLKKNDGFDRNQCKYNLS